MESNEISTVCGCLKNNVNNVKSLTSLLLNDKFLQSTDHLFAWLGEAEEIGSVVIQNQGF